VKESGRLEFIGTDVDVTDRKLADEEVRRSQTYLAEAESLSHTGRWAWKVKTGALFWSLEHFRIYGVDPEAFELTIENAQELIHSDDRAAASQAFYKAIEERREFEWNLRIHRPDGTIRYVHSLAHPVFDELGQLTEYVGTIIDLTDRKRAEDELRRSEAYLAEGQRLTKTGSWGWSASTGDIYWSEEQFRVFGRDPHQGTPSLEQTFQLIHPDDRPSVQQAFETVLRDAIDRGWDCRIVGSDGAIKYVHTTAHPVCESGMVKEVIGTTMDITEKRQAEVDRGQLLRRVISAHEEERRRISREIHDELGQQVSVLTLKVSTLKLDCGNEPGIRAQIQSVEDVLHQLDANLDFLVWNLRPTALDDLGLSVALSNVITHWAKDAAAHAELHTAGMEEHRLAPDVEIALYRIVQEALNNIAKHAGARNVHVFLERRAGYVSLIVEDDGKGFEADKILNSGKGAGLIGMRERSTLLGGTFEVESRRRHGTTVVVQIPLDGDSTEEPRDG
jgi:PAS domain S-box-containing protein